MDSKTKWIFASTLALFLVTGVLAGVVLERTVLAPRSAVQPQNRPAQPPAPGQHGGQGRNAFDPLERIAKQMTSELSLDENQQKELFAILERYKTKFEAVRADIKKEFDALDAELSRETMKILTDEQKELFEKKFVRWPQPAAHPHGQQGPPREILDACQGKPAGADCSFTIHGERHTGRCGTGARGENLCIPPMPESGRAQP